MKEPYTRNPVATSLSKITLRGLVSIFISLLTSAGYTSSAQMMNFSQVRAPKFHNETTDTIRLNDILIREASAASPGEITRIAREFIGTPYKSNTLEEDSLERLTVNLDEFDCMTFAETIAALALTADARRQSWRDFIYNLEQIRYRNGKINGYPSRLHYFSEWVLDNTARGNIKEITQDIPGAIYKVKSLCFMSDNAKSYPALADLANLAGIKSVEAGLSNHRYPILRASAAKDKKLRNFVKDGDIIAFTTATKGLDVTHVGIVAVDGNKPLQLIHASSKEGKVEIEPSLEEYINRRKPEGIRIIRLRRD